MNKYRNSLINFPVIYVYYDYNSENIENLQETLNYIKSINKY